MTKELLLDALQLNPHQISVLKEYSHTAYEALDKEVEAKQEFKDILEAVSDATSIEKRLVSKLFKTIHKAKLEEVVAEAEQLSQLNDVLGR